ncbi:MAG: c-type heme family protein [Steroidobacteraceae bacterium]
MNLLVRLNVVLIIAFAVVGFIAYEACAALQQVDARRQVLATAGLMLDSALASRAYTADEIDPLLEAHMQDSFPPQVIPFYAATQTFNNLRKVHPEFTYKEATLNPTNPRDRATDWEADIIDQFRNHPGSQQIEGERATPMGRSLYLARPIRARPECLACHGMATAAPATLIARYGHDNGFGWQADEVIGAQIVAVPITDAAAGAQHLFSGVTAVIIAVLVALLAVVNVTVYWMLLRPLSVITRHADQVSLGQAAEVTFASGRKDEIGALGDAFERMRKSLEKAMKMIGGPGRGT